MRDHSTPGADAGKPANAPSALQGYVDGLPSREDGFVPTKVAAEMLGTSTNTLNTARSTGHGLLGQVPFYKTRAFNGRVLYRVEDIEAHLSRFGRVDSRWGRLAATSSKSEG
jgi:hypothetical protein